MDDMEELEAVIGKSYCPSCNEITPDIGNGGIGIVLIRCAECKFVKARQLQ